ncbi:MAG: ATP-dependent DNA helicase [Magnetospiraceae bacterium]
MPPQPLLPSGLLACVAGNSQAVLTPQDGTGDRLSLQQAAMRLRQGGPVLACHGRHLARRMNLAPFPVLDLLELFAFVRPAAFCVPTPGGLATALGLPVPESLAAQAAALFQVAETLLAELGKQAREDRAALPIAWAMTRANWPWGGIVLKALGSAGEIPHSGNLAEGLRVWRRLPDWQDFAPPPPADQVPVDPKAVRDRLTAILGPGAEHRPQQFDYAAALAGAFDPRDQEGEPPVVLAEAGTGVGKTLGYIAPATLWVERNHGAVWISTYTRNLQRQVDGELDRLYPDPVEKRRRVVVRKGRENYLCLLNMEEAVGRLGLRPGDAVALGLMARWAGATRDGDMVGGDFPGWLGHLVGRALTLDLTDTRGECVFSACPHYGKCFVERAIRRARRAHVIVANHALVLVQAALGGVDDHSPPTRIIFDEGHHLFDAADSAFSAALSGQESADLRRWLRGAEEGARSRSRGLKDRLAELPLPDLAFESLSRVLEEALSLPGPGWHQRIAGGMPRGTAERFLSLVRQQVFARADKQDTLYSLETATRPTVPGLEDAAADLQATLEDLLAPLMLLRKHLAALLDDEAASLETPDRLRIDALARGVERRGVMPAQAWISMLKALREDTPPGFVDWMAVERRGGQDADVGLYRHWVDPTIPLIEMVLQPAHGVAITSATLRDSVGQEDADWQSAETRAGTRHLRRPATRFGAESPFDYATNTRVLVVTDVDRNRADQVSAAYRDLFLASGGGGLGIFTAIGRLRAVHQRIAAPLDQAGIPLLAQHVDAMDTGTLVDIFRAEEASCLLGTDAVRDGVDVPGRSLRLIVFDRVPWPRPSILHRERRRALADSGKAYDEELVRLKLKQAFGRLVRRAEDRGVFVMLDRAMPSRLLPAFPPGVPVERVGLAEAISAVRAFDRAEMTNGLI